MLKRLRLKDFKSFVDEEVPLAPLTLLLGANASGKSNFLDALQFLHANSFDLELEQILNGEQKVSSDAWKGLRGGTSETVRLGASQFTIESDWAVTLLEPDESDVSSDSAYREVVSEFVHQMTCRIDPSPLLESESLTLKGEATLQSEARLFSARQSVFLWPQKSALDRRKLLFAFPSRELDKAFSRIEFLNIQPAAMRGYGRRNAPLGEEGRNLSGVLARLCEEPEAKRALVDWMVEFCAPEIADIDFVEVKELGDVMAMFVEKGGRRVSARSASDGTLRFLGTLLALRLAPKGSVILLEELDSGLHPTRIKLLVEYLEAVTRERDIQVIATTHSPVILQWLSEQTLRDSLVFGRIPEHEGTRVRRLGDLPHFEEVAQRKSIDELFTTGWMEMAL